MAKYDLSMIKDNNQYKEQCEHAEESLNRKWYSESILTMSIALEELTEELIDKYAKNIPDINLTQSIRIGILKDNGIINYNTRQDLRNANILRNSLVHGQKLRNHSNTYSMYNKFLKIMVWYDENYVIGKLNTNNKLKQYLNKVCDDSDIINIIEQEINDGIITENHQIKQRCKKELIDYVESLNIELEIKEKLIKDIYSGDIKNRSLIEEKIKRQKKDPIIGVVNIINTENLMKYTIQSTDIDRELRENMEKLQNNAHENKQLQEDYNTYGSSSFTTETVTICKNKEQSQMVKEDEIIFNASKSYNNNKKEKAEEDKLDDKLPEPVKKDPQIGVANIVNTENMMKYTIQSTDIDKELRENMEKLQNNAHENKQLQEDYNTYGSSSFTTETVTICKNKEQSQMVKEDEIIFNASKSYNNNKKEKAEEDKLDDKISELTKEVSEEENMTPTNKLYSQENQSNKVSNRIKKLFKR